MIAVRKVQRGYNVRDLSYADRSIIRGLDRLCFPWDEPYDPRYAFWWIAWDRDAPVGFSGLKPLRNEPGTAFMCRVGVLATHRGTGLGRKLIRCRIAWARRNPDITTLVTYTMRSNLASANNLLREGFRLYEPDYKYGGEALYFTMDVS